MSRMMRPTGVRSIVFGVTLVAAAICTSAAAQAADFGAPPVYGPGPDPPPNYGPGPVYPQAAPCRIVLDRRVDPYGREFVHRVRVCDEGPMYPAAEGLGPPPPTYGYPGPRYYEPQPSGYYGYPPRPPAPVGPGYYN